MNEFSKKSFGVMLVVAFAFSACENMGKTEKGALAGTALGAGMGAVIGSATGNAGVGTAIGGAAGAISGALIGGSMEQTDKKLDAQDRRIGRQQEELDENRRLIDELRASGTEARSTSRGVLVNLPDVLFEFGKARLTSSARNTVRDIAIAAEKTNRRIAVEGHTDSVGTVSFNQRLSEDRAQSVADALVENGVSSRRISSRGYGETRPITSNKSENDRRRNRRVEVIIENR